MIVGIALVVDELSKGQRLVYRYPQHSEPDHSPQLKQFHEQFLALSPENFARAFRPNAALCDQLFELRIDGLQFISHPILCVREEGAAAQPVSKGTVVRMFNVVVALIHEPTLLSTQAGALANSYPPGIMQTRGWRAVASSPGTNPMSALLGLNGPAFIHRDVVRNVVRVLARALHREEKRVKYVTNEVTKMLALHEDLRAIHDAKTVEEEQKGDLTLSKSISEEVEPKISRTPSNGMGPQHGDETQEWDPNFVEAAVDHSCLARELTHVYTALYGACKLDLTINSAVNIHVNLEAGAASSSDAPQQPTYTDALIRKLRPYHTLMLLVDRDTARDILADTVSRSVEEFLAYVDCTVTFEEIARALLIPLDRAYKLAIHLSSWGVARIIKTITMQSVYKVHPAANLSSNTVEAKAFASEFHGINLPETLSYFTGTHTVEQIGRMLPQAAAQYIVDICMWLLQRFMLQEVDQFVVCLRNEGLPSVHQLPSRTTPAKPVSSFGGGGSGDTGENDEFASILTSLLPYFDGTTRMEDILWREGLRYEDLTMMLSHYKSQYKIVSRPATHDFLS